MDLSRQARHPNIMCKRSAISVRGGLLFCCLLLLTYLWIATANGQTGTLIEREPFDQITLKTSGEVIEVYPLDLPNRVVPPVDQRKGEIRIRRVLDNDEYDINWSEIESIALFERRVLEQATASWEQVGDFDQAFQLFYFLQQRYPDLSGLLEEQKRYLAFNAKVLRDQKKLHQALSTIEELYKLDSESAAASQGLNSIATDLVQGYRTKDDLTSAKTLMLRLMQTYGEEKLPGLRQVRDELDGLAAIKRDEAQALVKEERFREAFQVCNEMLVIWPNVAGGRQLAQKISELYPLVTVGTHQLAAVFDSSRIDHWASRRTGRLTKRMLLEFEGAGPKGGRYESAFGSSEQGEDRRSLTLQLDPEIRLVDGSKLTAYSLSQRLRNMADPTHAEYVSHWGSLLEKVSVLDVFRLRIDLRRPHVLPESMLQVPVFPEDMEQRPIADGPYRVAESTPQEMRFLANKNYELGSGRQPAEILEIYYDDRDKALAALQNGLIDVLDQISPADARTLQGDPSLEIKQYAHPTLHLLVPNYDHEFLARRSFRGGLLQAINRKRIFSQLVLKGEDIPGCEIISGPFAPGVGEKDPLNYAYDHDLEPRNYDPRLSMLLLFMAEYELQQIAEKRGEKEGPKLADMKPLVLGHPRDPMIKAICTAIQDQLKLISIPCQLKELPVGRTRDPDGKCDLTYTEIAMWEPINDARRLLRPDGGILGDSSQYLDQALRRLDASQTWTTVRPNLVDLHQLTHYELPVIPLWQTVNYFAHRKGLLNVGSAPVVLYQNVENWQITPRIP
ncbi:MAG: hypothetical protein CMJ75_20155 [Planctomycetaceae bacterium]|nr:hypothetical protein [Planctomycetaceae bacterium]